VEAQYRGNGQYIEMNANPVQAEPAVALVATVHDPDRRLMPIVEARLPALVAHYDALVAYCSGSTHGAILALLRECGASVHVDDLPSAGIEGMGEVRRRSLRAGLGAGTSHLHICDFDRALHWIAYYPQELAEVIASIPNYDLLVLGRTTRAWATHPPYQAETEPLFNKVFALVTGLPWDVGAGSRGFSRRAAGLVLAHSREQTIGVDAEWPLLLLGQDSFRVDHRLCEGLEFETADCFGPEIEAAGSYRAWVAQMSADPARWAFRLKVAQLIAEAAVRYGRSMKYG
jgi:hypothetical protein